VWRPSRGGSFSWLLDVWKSGRTWLWLDRPSVTY
jgi:hypothetical protein